ncbi:MAG: helix-turn-helix domain-containing protein [Bacteroides sp.]|nr:helix-turn-helix domain-containing protein [Bacteroides sp.]
MTTKNNQVEIIDSGEGKVPFIGRHCAIFREMNGWNQDVLAEKLNVSQQAVSKYENARELPLHIVRKIAEIFGVNIYYLTKAKENELKSVYQNNAYDHSFNQSSNVLWSTTVNVNPTDAVLAPAKYYQGQIDKYVKLYTNSLSRISELEIRQREFDLEKEELLRTIEELRKKA